MRSSSSSNRSPIRLLRCGLAGPVLFAVVFLVEGALRPGYSPWRHAVSQLSLGEGGWINVAAIVLTGVLMLAFAQGVGAVFPSGRGAVWGPRLLRSIGLSLIAAGVFATDPALGYPPGVPETYTISGLIHSIAGLVLFASLSAVCLVFARRFARDPEWQGWAGPTAAAGITVAASFVACTVLYTLDQQGVLSPAPSGLFQRVALLCGLGWLALFALRLTRQALERQPSAERGRRSA